MAVRLPGGCFIINPVVPHAPASRSRRPGCTAYDALLTYPCPSHCPTDHIEPQPPPRLHHDDVIGEPIHPQEEQWLQFQLVSAVWPETLNQQRRNNQDTPQLRFPGALPQPDCLGLKKVALPHLAFVGVEKPALPQPAFLGVEELLPSGVS